MSKANALPGQLVEVGCPNGRVSVGGEAVAAMLVRHDEEDIRA
jgi:hypothetical protein